MDGRKRRARSEFLWGWGMILPAIVGLIILNIIPIFQTIYQSFFKTGAFGRSYIFIGAQNYQKLIQDKDVFLATINTFQFVLLEVPVSIILALILAVLLNRPMKGRSAFRTIIFVPMVAAPAAVAMVWKWLLNSKFGLVNHFLNSIGLSSVDWLSDSKVALLSVAIVGIWSILGYNMVLFLAGDRGAESRASAYADTGLSVLQTCVPAKQPRIWSGNRCLSSRDHHADYGIPDVGAEKVGLLRVKEADSI